MPLNLSILYRGPLSSCNFDCPYCPLVKHRDSPAELEHDRNRLERFCRWVAGRDSDGLSVFFTPWGEALVRRWYRDAVVALSRLPHVRKVAVQTNLSCGLDWLARADAQKVGLWCTYHPGGTTLEAFVAQCGRLDRLGVGYSVGCVGLKEHLTDIRRLREMLAPDRYVWINAYKDVPDYYDRATLAALTKIDPLFPLNNVRHSSLGRPCKCGATVFAVDGDGNVRRCHFVKRVIGNIHESGFDPAPLPDACPNETCDCHIGYVHMDRLQLYSVFGDGVLERVPTDVQFGHGDHALPMSHGLTTVASPGT